MREAAGALPADKVTVGRTDAAFAGRYFVIDYDPVAPSSLKDANQLLEDEMGEEMAESANRRRHSSPREMFNLVTFIPNLAWLLKQCGTHRKDKCRTGACGCL